MTMTDDRPVDACPRCGGPKHPPLRTVITSLSDALYNDRIERECEARQLDRMRDR